MRERGDDSIRKAVFLNVGWSSSQCPGSVSGTLLFEQALSASEEITAHGATVLPGGISQGVALARVAQQGGVTWRFWKTPRSLPSVRRASDARHRTTCATRCANASR